jgi:tetratricopeptide (TPR) repeat protein
VILRRTRLAATALAVASLGSWPAVGVARSAVPPVERDLGRIEEQMAVAERAAASPEESRRARAQRRFQDGVRQYAVGDWVHAALMLTEAVDEPEWERAPERGRATFLLADALRRHGLCGAARVRYAELLARPDAPQRAEAVSGALDCALKERRRDDVERLVREAERVYGDTPPAEVRYLAAKAAYQRADLPRAERVERALEAFAQVHGAFQLQAWYFQGVLEVEDENLHASVEYFESCARAAPETARDREVRELCLLAAGRVHAELGDVAAALEWYGHVPASSAHFAEAVHEMALAHVKAKQWEDALRLVSIVPELAPDAPEAPEATLLRGHLLLRLRRWGEATAAYDRVIDAYAPVRDELDAILATRDDPVRYFDELIGRPGGAFDVASLLPPVAVRWATTSPEVSAAVDLVRGVGAARGEVQAGRDLADRLEALLRRGGGIDAFPPLLSAFAQAEAAQNASARAEAAWVAAAAAAAERGALPGRRAELARARAARAAEEARMERLPRTAAEVDARRVRLHRRVDEAGQGAFRLVHVLEGSRAAIAGIEGWLDRHRNDVGVELEARQELGDELRRHRGVIDGYEEELAAIQLDLAKVRDAAGGVDAMREEARIRDAYLAVVEREGAAALAAADVVDADEQVLFEAMPAVHSRFATIRARARELEGQLAAEARRRAAAVQARIDAERGALSGHLAALDRVQGDARDVLGLIAIRSLADVRTAFYRLVLKADLGIVDVAWSRKRQRLEKIQALAVQKDAEVEQLDREYRAVLREEE